MQQLIVRCKGYERNSRAASTCVNAPMTMVWLRGNGGKSYFGCAESFCSELIHRAGVKFFSPEPYNSLTFTDALNWVKHNKD